MLIKKDDKKCTSSFDNYDIELAMQILSNILEMIARCDSKISYLLSAMSLVTVFEMNLIDFNFFDRYLFSSPTFLSIIISLFFLAGVLSIIIAIFLSINSISPKLRPFNNDKGLETNSVLYFGSIHVNTYNEFYKKYSDMSSKQIYNDVLSQIYINSVICNKKYKMLKYNSFYFLVSFVCLLLFVVMQNVCY